MVRDKQIGLKFAAEDVARWDAFAESQGLTRTTLIEKAVENYMQQRGAPVTKHSEDELEKVEERRKLDTYPAAPTDPAERQAWFTRRNEAIQRGVPAPKSGTFGKPPKNG